MRLGFEALECRQEIDAPARCEGNNRLASAPALPVGSLPNDAGKNRKPARIFNPVFPSSLLARARLQCLLINRTVCGLA
jgi:hypothetical protein